MKFFLSISILLSIGLSAFTISIPYDPVITYQQEEAKIKISPDELPEEVHIDIRDSYHNAPIVESYKTTINGEHSGYLVKVKKGPKEWFITYDKNGNSENKINPID